MSLPLGTDGFGVWRGQIVPCLWGWHYTVEESHSWPDGWQQKTGGFAFTYAGALRKARRAAGGWKP